MPAKGYRKPPQPCSIDGCGGEAKSKGYCIKHYTRLLRHCDLGVKKVANGTALKWLQDHVFHEGDDCLIWPYAKMQNGYAIVRFEGRSQIASRVMCILRHGASSDPKLEAAHSCGKGHEACVNPNHIRWATVLENNQDKILHGTSRRGEESPVAKLSNDQAAKIKKLLGRVSQRELAARFGVTQGCISDISRGTNWAWLK